MVVCLERGDTASESPVICCLINSRTGFTFLVPAYPGCPGKQAVEQLQLLDASGWRVVQDVAGGLLPHRAIFHRRRRRRTRYSKCARLPQQRERHVIATL